MKAILVGARGVSRELLRRLGELWEVTVVDTSPERLARCKGLLRAGRSLEGDGSSRVVLSRAGLEKADALVAATDDDETNLEACRLALDAGIHRVVAVASDPERAQTYRVLGVTAVSPDSLAARRIELGLETRRVSSVAFADGRAEAIEFRVAPDSPVCGRALSELHARSWIVGAILRGSELIVPHGDTVFKPGDAVTVVGAGTDFAEIVRTFTAGEVRFPLQFGKRVAVAVDSAADMNGAFSEAMHLVRNSRASSLLMVHRNLDTLRDETRAGELRDLLERAAQRSNGVSIRPRPVDQRPLRALASFPGGESVGVVVLRVPGKKGPAVWRTSLKAASIARRSHRPVLLARGSYPYRRILVPARRTAAGRSAVRTAIDLAYFTKAELCGPVVLDPVFISGLGDPGEAQRTIGWLEEEAAVHGVRVEGQVKRGNPARTLLELGEQADLLVLGLDVRHPRFSLRVGIAEYVARCVSKSVLFVPAVDDVVVPERSAGVSGRISGSS